MKFSNILLLIDPQVDFCDPSGSLFVPGADQDMARLCQWWEQSCASLQGVMITQDCHTEVSIFFQKWFKNRLTKQLPSPFTQITKESMNDKWETIDLSPYTYSYISELEEQGNFVHTIWPYHCIEGTPGQECIEIVKQQVHLWENQDANTGNHKVYWITKGQETATEHYGAFKAEVSFDLSDKPYSETNTAVLNQPALDYLNDFETIYLAGEAKSHCVVTSLKQLIKYAPHLIPRIKIMRDAISPVTGFETLGDAIFAQAIELGAQWTTTEERIK